MRRVVRGLLAAAAVVAVLGFAPPGAHGAPVVDGCDDPVFDPAAVLGPVDLAPTISRLTGFGVRVHVRVERDAGPTSDGRMDQLVAACPSWQDTDGHRLESLLSIIVLTDARQTGVFYGDALQARLDSTVEQVKAGKMNPRFKEGAFGTGMADGLAELAHLVDPATPAPIVPAPPRAPADDPPQSEWLIAALLVPAAAGVIALVVATTRGVRADGWRGLFGAARPSSPVDGR